MADDKQAVTVDTTDFRLKLPMFLPDHTEKWAELVAHIDRHTSEAVARAVAEALEKAQSTYAPTEGEAWAIYNKDANWGHEPTAKGLFIDGYRAAKASPVAATGVEVIVDRGRVWIKRGVQSFMLEYDSDTDEEQQWYADQLRSVLAAHTQQTAAVPAEQKMVIGFPDPNAVFAAFCDREGYPSDGDMDEPLRKAFWEAVRMFSGDIPAVPTQPPAGELPVLPDLVSMLTEYLQREMPAGTVIGDPAWWAPRIANALATRQPAPVADAISPHHEQQAACWRAFERVRKTNRIDGVGYGRRFKIIEICPQTGDETEFDGFETAIRDEAIRALNKTGEA